MLGKQLLVQLKTLAPNQWKVFLRWLQSPVHNTDEGLYRLGEFLRSQAPFFPPEKMDKQQLWDVLYPHSDIKEGVLRVKIRQLTKQAEDFLVWSAIKADSNLYHRLHLRRLLVDSDYSYFERLVLKQVDQLEGQERIDLDHFYHRAALYYLLVNHPGYDGYRAKGNYLQQIDESVDAFYTLMKYRIGTELGNRSRILGEEYEITLWEELQDLYQSGAMEGNPIGHLYHLLFVLLDDPTNLQHYEELKAAFLSYRAKLPLRDLASIYFSTLNYLGRRINQGRSQDYLEMLEWYKLGLEQRFLLRQGQISEVTFNNIALLGYESGEFNWTGKFLKQYQPYLPAKVQEDAVQASEGLGLFYLGAYRQAIRTLKGHRFSAAYQLRIRLTIIRSLFELHQQGQDVFDELERNMANFESYLRRNKTFGSTTLIPYQNHLRILREIMGRGTANSSSRQQLRKWIEGELEQDGRVVAKRWLLGLVG